MHTHLESATPATQSSFYTSPHFTPSHNSQLLPLSNFSDDFNAEFQSNARCREASSKHVRVFTGLGIRCIEPSPGSATLASHEMNATWSLSSLSAEGQPKSLQQDGLHPSPAPFSANSEIAYTSHFPSATSDDLAYSEVGRRSVDLSQEAFTATGLYVSCENTGSQHSELAETQTSVDFPSSWSSPDSVHSFFHYSAEGTFTHSTLDDNFGRSNSSINPSSSESLAVSSSIQSLSEMLASDSSPPVVPFLDLNMFSVAFSRQEPSVGVNPAETMRDNSISVPSTPLLLGPISDSMQGPDSPLMQTTVAGLSAPFMDELKDILTKSTTQSMEIDIDPSVKVEVEDLLSALLPDPAPSPSPMTPALQPDTFQPLSTSGTQTVPNVSDMPRKTAVRTKSQARKGRASKHQRSSPNVPMEEFCQTPVLNAHLGIDVTDFESRAEKFRTRNPGQDLSRKWLLSYTGKLSARGELIEDYRCYIVGCNQRNKRRDHILIHLGSHVDQRPWVCEQWYVVRLCLLMWSNRLTLGKQHEVLTQ